MDNSIISKKCSECGEIKLLSDFNKRKGSKDGFRSDCRSCRKKKNKEYYRKNSKKISAKNKKYRLNNLEEVRLKEKIYYIKNITNRKKSMKKYRDENKEIFKRSSLKFRFNITLEQLDEMFVIQKNKCFLCNSEKNGNQKKKLAIDHCHKSGKIRGLLCDTCNRYVGLFESGKRKMNKENFKYNKTVEYLKLNGKHIEHIIKGGL
jgi:hypothetical protein